MSVNHSLVGGGIQPFFTNVTWTTKVQMKVPVAAGLATRIVVNPLMVLAFGCILQLRDKSLTSDRYTVLPIRAHTHRAASTPEPVARGVEPSSC